MIRVDLRHLKQEMTWVGVQDLFNNDIALSFTFNTLEGSEIYCPNIVDITLASTMDHPSVTTIEGDSIFSINGNLLIEEGETIGTITIESSSTQGGWQGTMDISVYNSSNKELEEFSEYNFPGDGGYKSIDLDYPISEGTTQIGILLNNWNA